MSNDPTEAATPGIPTMQEFCAEVPLYASFPLEGTERSDMFYFIENQVNVDLFCVDCGKPSVFIGMKIELGMMYYDFDFGIVFSPRSSSVRGFTATKLIFISRSGRPRFQRSDSGLRWRTWQKQTS